MSLAYTPTTEFAVQPAVGRAAAPTLGVLYACGIVVAAGLLAIFDGVTIGSLQLSGWTWLLFLGAGILLALGRMASHKSLGSAFPALPWVGFVGWLWLSLIWGSGGTRNLQDAMQISMPLFVGIICSGFVRTRADLQLVLRSAGPAMVFLLISVAAMKAHLIPSPEEQGNRVASLTATLVGMVFLAGFPLRKFVPLLGWGAAMVYTVVSGSRMATVGLLLVPVFHPLIRPVWIRPMMLGVLIVVGVFVFYSPVFQERFFANGSGDLQDVWEGNMLDFGRFEAWPTIWERAWRQPVAGYGVGYAYEYVPTIWPGMTMVHNDYLRVFVELGLVGLAFLLFAGFWQVYDLWRRIRRSDGLLRVAFTASCLGLIAFFVMAFTDNILSYNVWYTNPLFAIMGAAYGVAAQEAADRRTSAALARQEARR